MNRRLAQLIVRLYPRSWRNRYGAEFEAFLHSRQPGIRECADVLRSAIRERMVPTWEDSTARDSRVFASLCLRAPWAIFGLAPMFLLAAAYFLACVYLWLGWRIFLPGTDTPFGQGGAAFLSLRNIYFQGGRLFYFGAPVFVGWITTLTAIRQSVRFAWLAPGLALVAWMGCAARIEASRVTVHGGLGNIRMDFPLSASLESIYHTPAPALTITVLTLLPYLLWLGVKDRRSMI